MSRNNYQHLTIQPTATSPRRLKILRNIMLVLLAIILIRLFFIQIIEYPVWTAKASEEHTILETIAAERGEIYMMDEGEPVPVALNQTTYQIVIDPAITDQEGITNALNQYAKDYIATNLEEVYRTEGLRYAIVAKNVPQTVADKIAAENLSAIWFKNVNQRVYPEGDMAAGLLTRMGLVNTV